MVNLLLFDFTFGVIVHFGPVTFGSGVSEEPGPTIAFGYFAIRFDRVKLCVGDADGEGVPLAGADLYYPRTGDFLIIPHRLRLALLGDMTHLGADNAFCAAS